ncbi:MAG TPA: hypothetical protein VFX12_15120 [Vicinamibacterales bacterium]|nr:hypothetical protein [Vicinamibacterales bacterium]
MKRKLGFTAAMVVALAMMGYAQQKPDFSGTWTLDQEKSEMGQGGGGRMMMGGGSMTIKQTADALTVERQGRGGNTMSTEYKLDGTESDVPMGRGGTAKAKAHWDGSTLVIETTGEGPNGPMTQKSSYSLAADGTLVVESTGRNGNTRKLVYKKAS